jgi:hypothetical protein
MSRSAQIELDWADGTYTFRLAWKELGLLQEACDAGPLVVLSRLQDGTWRIDDISHVLRLGLIGGGMSPAEALKKIRAYVMDRVPAENALAAQVVLAAACYGAPEESVGNPEAASQGSVSMTSRTESSGSPPSTEQEP